MTDDFCKEMDRVIDQNSIVEDAGKARRKKPSRMSGVSLELA